MTIFERKSPPLQVGDRFRKAGDRFGKVWKVSRLWVTGDGLLHARLKGQEMQSETRIISAITLTDSQFFSTVPAARAEE